MSGDTGGNGGVVGVNRDCVCGSVRIGVIDYHLREVKAVTEVREDRCADEATGQALHVSKKQTRSVVGLKVLPAMADHECHFGRGHRIRSDDEIALIFAVLRVEHNYEFTISCGPK